MNLGDDLIPDMLAGGVDALVIHSPQSLEPLWLAGCRGPERSYLAVFAPAPDVAIGVALNMRLAQIAHKHQTRYFTQEGGVYLVCTDGSYPADMTGVMEISEPDYRRLRAGKPPAAPEPKATAPAVDEIDWDDL